jgi:hypothetical protein
MARDKKEQRNGKSGCTSVSGEFLFKAARAIEKLGVIGERRNCLIVTLAAVTRVFDSPVSVLMKGAASTGKSTVIKRSLDLHPPEVLIERASLSEKALAHGKDSLAHKIIYLNEYRGGKDSRLLMRLLQSEGAIAHEYTRIRGTRRDTKVAVRSGSPAVLSTTTERKVFEDDETRFLSVWADESSKQTLAILRARARGDIRRSLPNLSRWHSAFRAMIPDEADFRSTPTWLRYVAENLPHELVRVRRDWDRFYTLLQAVALTRKSPKTRTAIEIEFADYCVAYRILEPAMAATMRGVRTQEIQLATAVRSLSKHDKEVSIRDLAAYLGWKEAVTYKHAKSAVEHSLVRYAPGVREQNRKPLMAVPLEHTSFLPRPRSVLKHNPEIGKEVQYIDPFTGKERTIARSNVD